MPMVQVLMGENGEVLGTARVDIPADAGPDAPAKVSMVAGEGQQVVELNVDDDVANYEPEALHEAIRSQQAK
jgi:hypothetical protein